MNILITNDDGIFSNGIIALEKIIKTKHNTFFIAPSKERSATSQAMSIHDKIKIQKVSENHYIVDGFPVDCVNIGLHGNIFPNIDIVISGINRGVNMGSDIHYSGTVGAARHACLHNKISIAVSSGKIGYDSNYDDEAEVVLNFIEKKIEQLQCGIVYNINFPTQFSKEISKIKVTRMGHRTYTDMYSKESLGDSNSFEYFLGGSILGHIETDQSDFEAFNNGFISLTPLLLDVTNYQEEERLRKLFI